MTTLPNYISIKSTGQSYFPTHILALQHFCCSAFYPLSRDNSISCSASSTSGHFRSAWGFAQASRCASCQYCFLPRQIRQDLPGLSAAWRQTVRLCACSYSGKKSQQLTGRAGHWIRRTGCHRNARSSLPVPREVIETSGPVQTRCRPRLLDVSDFDAADLLPRHIYYRNNVDNSCRSWLPASDENSKKQ